MADREKRRTVKQRIRDTRRLLSKEDLPETVRLTKERVLKCLNTELEERRQEARDRKMNKRYRMVKFFDKRKVMRKLKVQQKKWQACNHVTKRHELLSSVQQLRRELNYTVHFPLSEKYLALYPSTECTDGQAVIRKGELLQQVAEMVDSGELADASSSLLAPALLSHFSTSGSHSKETETTPRIANVEVETRLTGFSKPDLQLPSLSKRTKEKSFNRKRKRYTACIDEEPEGDIGVEMVTASRHLAREDDFFMEDS